MGSSLVVAGVLFVPTVALAVVVLVRRPSMRVAQGFARQWRLPITPEVAAWVAWRRRIHMVSAIATIGVLGGALLGLFVYVIDHVGPSSVAEVALSGSGLVGIWLFGPVANVVAHMVDASIAGRRPGVRVARLSTPELADFIPPILIWVVRAIWLLPAVAMTTWLAVPAGASGRLWPHRFSPAVWLIAVSVPLVGVLVEAWQRRIVRGPQRAASGLELAYDDAFRASTVQQMLLIGVWVASLGVNLIAGPALAAAQASPGALVAMVIVPLFLGLGIQIATATLWARMHYRTRLAPAGPPPATVLTTAPAAS